MKKIRIFNKKNNPDITAESEIKDGVVSACSETNESVNDCGSNLNCGNGAFGSCDRISEENCGAFGSGDGAFGSCDSISEENCGAFGSGVENSAEEKNEALENTEAYEIAEKLEDNADEPVNKTQEITEEKKAKEEKKAEAARLKAEKKAEAESLKAKKKAERDAKKLEKKNKKSSKNGEQTENIEIADNGEQIKTAQNAEQIECEEGSLKKAKNKSKKKLARWKKVLIITLSAVVALVGGALTAVKIIMSGGGELKTFTVSGTVRVDGIPVEGFTVKSSSSEAITDENGYYVLSGIIVSTTVSVSDDLYYFGDVSKEFTKDSTFDIDGRSYKKVEGTVKNGGKKLSGVVVKITGENGSWTITTDDDGNFAFDRTVGEVTIEAVDESGDSLFDKVIKEDEVNKDVEINATTSFSLVLGFADGLDAVAFSYTYKGQTVAFSGSVDNKTIIFDEANYGNEIVLLSDEYGFAYISEEDNRILERIDSIKITEENAKKKIAVFKKYDICGQAVSGVTPIRGATVLIDGKKACETDENGKFFVENFIGVHTVIVKKDGFTVSEKQADKDVCDIKFELKKTVRGVVTSDCERGEASVYAGTALIGKTDFNGNFKVESEIGSVLTFDYDGYFIENNGATEIAESTGRITVKAYKLFNPEIKVAGADLPDEVEIIADGKTYTVAVEGVGANRFALKTFASVYGKFEFTVLTDGYEYTYTAKGLDWRKDKATVTAVKIFSVKGVVKSGDVIISDAEIFLNGKKAGTADENGEFLVLNVRTGDTIKIKAAGYDEFVKTVTAAVCEISANLSYSVILGVKNGDNSVSNFTVSYNGEETEAGTTVEIKELYGENAFSFTKDYYEIESVSVKKGGKYFAAFTYSIEVKAFANGAPLAGRKIGLIDIYGDEDVDEDTIDKDSLPVTDENGSYIFTGLSSEYTLFTVDENNVHLSPEKIEVKAGGVYQFADKGYGFEGRVTVGGEPLEHVKLTAGSRITYTDKDGRFSFSMLTDDVALTIVKEGYEFDKYGLTLTQDDNGKVIEITATYYIKGTINSGEKAVSGAQVKLGENYSATTDENGYYKISGIAETGETLTIEKEGFIIDGATVTGYAVIDRTAYLDVTVVAASGSVDVDGAAVLVNGKEQTRFLIGDTVTAEKRGYVFESITLTEADAKNTVRINGTYSVSGEVRNGTEYLKNVQVFVNGVLTLTVADGKFSISGLSGENVLTFSCAGFKIAPITVNAPASELTATTSYDITVSVVCGDIKLSGVTVSVGKNTILTDENGKAVFTGLGGKNNITVSKDGYEFTGGQSVVTGAVEGDIVFNAEYSVSAKVLCCGKGLSGVKVSVKGTLKSVLTANDGTYSLKGLSGALTIVMEKNGYVSREVEIKGPYNEDVSLAYYVVIEFGGDTNFAGITVTYGNDNFTDSVVTENNESLKLGPFTEAITITFSKFETGFDPVKLAAEGYIERSVTVAPAYTVSGTITTQSGIPVIGMTIKAGDIETKTDESGKYKLDGLIGKVQIVGEMTGCEHNCHIDGIVNGTTTLDKQIDDRNYAFALYELNYVLRLPFDKGQAFEIQSTGTVEAAGQKQNSRYIRKQDGKGTVLTQNLNHGSVVFGVDPRVALLACYKPDGSVQYTEIHGDEVKNGYVNNYSGFINGTDTDYKNTYGNSASGIFVYNINTNTVDLSDTSTMKLTKSGSDYQMTMKLKMTAEMYSGYVKQIVKFGSVTFKKFNSVTLKFTFGANGWVKNVYIEENYVVNKVIDADTTGKFNYDYTYYDKLDLSGFKQDTETIKKMLEKGYVGD